MAEKNLGFIDINLNYDSLQPENFSKTALIENRLELFVQEVSLAVKLAPFDLYGLRDAIDLKRYVFNKYISTSRIKNEMTTFINNNCSNSQYFTFEIDVKFLLIDGKEMLYIIFTIYNPDTNEPVLNNKFLIG